MTEIYDLSKLKAIKTIKRDLEQLIPVLDLNIRGLTNYKHYIPIAAILKTIQEQKDILNIHLEKCKRTIKEKGKIGG